MKISWIGLGNMGLGTAKQVAAAGHRVTAFDVRPPKPEDAVGLVLKSSAREAAAGAELLCIAVFSDDQVEGLLLGPDGLFSVLEQGSIVAIFTTGTIASARALAAAAPAGIAVLDTCFSRRHAVLKAGQMNLLVGGDAEALDRCRPAFAAFVREIHHVGSTGAGRALKLVNNLLWVAHTQMADDALRLAESLGLDRLSTAEIILDCSGASDALHVFVRPEWRDTLAFMRPYMFKDASAAAEAARDTHTDLGTLGAVVKAYTPQS
jgi:3-hydroxyisobutyrate dehydrogenase-like beta-hydroxyacid dehydrogenase